jgi:hypothetical protein
VNLTANATHRILPINILPIGDQREPTNPRFTDNRRPRYL